MYVWQADATSVDIDALFIVVTGKINYFPAFVQKIIVNFASVLRAADDRLGCSVTIG